MVLLVGALMLSTMSFIDGKVNSIPRVCIAGNQILGTRYAILELRGGATKIRVNRKSKKLGPMVMISAFVKSMFDPTFGVGDIEQTPSKNLKSKMKKGKKMKLGTGGATHAGAVFSGATAGPVCGPNGCV